MVNPYGVAGVVGVVGCVTPSPDNVLYKEANPPI
jgi:hypothetical protein